MQWFGDPGAETRYGTCGGGAPTAELPVVRYVIQEAQVLLRDLRPRDVRRENLPVPLPMIAESLKFDESCRVICYK